MTEPTGPRNPNGPPSPPLPPAPWEEENFGLGPDDREVQESTPNLPNQGNCTEGQTVHDDAAAQSAMHPEREAARGEAREVAEARAALERARQARAALEEVQGESSFRVSPFFRPESSEAAEQDREMFEVYGDYIGENPYEAERLSEDARERAQEARREVMDIADPRERREGLLEVMTRFTALGEEGEVEATIGDVEETLPENTPVDERAGIYLAMGTVVRDSGLPGAVGHVRGRVRDLITGESLHPIRRNRLALESREVFTSSEPFSNEVSEWHGLLRETARGTQGAILESGRDKRIVGAGALARVYQEILPDFSERQPEASDFDRDHFDLLPILSAWSASLRDSRLPVEGEAGQMTEIMEIAHRTGVTQFLPEHLAQRTSDLDLRLAGEAGESQDPRRQIQLHHQRYLLDHAANRALGSLSAEARGTAPVFEEQLSEAQVDLEQDAFGLEEQARGSDNPMERVQILGDAFALHHSLAEGEDLGDEHDAARRRILDQTLEASAGLPFENQVRGRYQIAQRFVQIGDQDRADEIVRGLRDEATSLSRPAGGSETVVERLDALDQARFMFIVLGDVDGILSSTDRIRTGLRHLAQQAQRLEDPELQRAVHTDLATSYRQIGDEAQAEALSTQVLDSIRTSGGMTVEQRADCYLRVAQLYGDAVSNSLDRATRGDTERSGPARVYGRIMENLGQLGEENDRNDIVHYAGMMTALSQGNVEVAREHQYELEEMFESGEEQWMTDFCLGGLEFWRSARMDDRLTAIERADRLRTIQGRTGPTLGWLRTLVHDQYEGLITRAGQENEPTTPLREDQDFMERFLDRVQDLLAQPGGPENTEEAITQLRRNDPTAVNRFYQNINQWYESDSWMDGPVRHVWYGVADRSRASVEALIRTEQIQDEGDQAVNRYGVARDLITTDRLDGRSARAYQSIFSWLEQNRGDVLFETDRFFTPSMAPLRDHIDVDRAYLPYQGAAWQVADETVSVEGGVILLASLFTAGLAAELAYGATMARLTAAGIRTTDIGARLVAGSASFATNWAVFNAMSAGSTAVYRDIRGFRQASDEELFIQARNSTTTFGMITGAGMLAGPALGRYRPLLRFASGVAAMVHSEDVNAGLGWAPESEDPLGARYFRAGLQFGAIEAGMGGIRGMRGRGRAALDFGRQVALVPAGVIITAGGLGVFSAPRVGRRYYDPTAARESRPSVAPRPGPPPLAPALLRQRIQQRVRRVAESDPERYRAAEEAAHWRLGSREATPQEFILTIDRILSEWSRNSRPSEGRTWRTLFNQERARFAQPPSPEGPPAEVPPGRPPVSEPVNEVGESLAELHQMEADRVSREAHDEVAQSLEQIQAMPRRGQNELRGVVQTRRTAAETIAELRFQVDGRRSTPEEVMQEWAGNPNWREVAGQEKAELIAERIRTAEAQREADQAPETPGSYPFNPENRQASQAEVDARIDQVRRTGDGRYGAAMVIARLRATATGVDRTPEVLRRIVYDVLGEWGSGAWRQAYNAERGRLSGREPVPEPVQPERDRASVEAQTSIELGDLADRILHAEGLAPDLRLGVWEALVEGWRHMPEETALQDAQRRLEQAEGHRQDAAQRLARIRLQEHRREVTPENLTEVTGEIIREWANEGSWQDRYDREVRTMEGERRTRAEATARLRLEERGLDISERNSEAPELVRQETRRVLQEWSESDLYWRELAGRERSRIIGTRVARSSAETIAELRLLQERGLRPSNGNLSRIRQEAGDRIASMGAQILDGWRRQGGERWLDRYREYYDRDYRAAGGRGELEEGPQPPPAESPRPPAPESGRVPEPQPPAPDLGESRIVARQNRLVGLVIEEFRARGNALTGDQELRLRDYLTREVIAQDTLERSREETTSDNMIVSNTVNFLVEEGLPESVLNAP